MNDTIIFFVLAGLALVFKLLTAAANRGTGKPEDASPNEQRPAPRPASPSPRSEEERVRKFLEALGAPAGTPPPPPVRPRSVVPRAAPAPPARPQPRPARAPKVRRSWAQPLPPVVTRPPEPAPPQPVTPPPLPPTPLDVPVTSLPPITARPGPILSPGAPGGSVRGMLRRRGSLRQAVVLREVLGPPRGLLPLDYPVSDFIL